MLKFLRTFALAAAMMLPFAMQAQNTQTFDFEDNAVPADWTNDATHPWVVTNTSQGSGHTGTYCLKSGNTGVNNSTSTISATFNFAGEGTISFLGGCWGEGTSTAWDKCIFKIDDVQQFSYGARDTWETYTFDVDAGTHTFTWSFSKDGSVAGTGDAFFIDDVVVDLGTVPSCYKVTNLLVAAVSDESMTLNWTDTRNTDATYNVYMLTPTDTTPVESGISAFTYTVENLDANTQYVFGVASDCGSGDVTDMVTVSGRTACGVTPLPYTENFSGYTGLPSTPYYGPSVLPYCWGYYSNGTNTAETTGSSSYFGGVAQYSYTSSYACLVANDPYLFMPIQVTGSAVTNSTYIGYEAARGNTKFAVLPAFPTALSDLQISFDYKMSSAYSATGAATTLELGYITTDTSSFVSMQQYQAVSSLQHVVELSLVTLAADAPDGARLAFKFSGVHNGTGTSSYSTVYCGLDNIVVEEMPSCFHVTNLAVSATSSSSITLTWADDVNSSATYTVSDAEGVIASGITGTTYTVENLDANTEYTFNVVANCSATDASEAEAITGRTACAAMALPFTETFDTTLSTNPCWRGANILYTDSVTVTMGNNSNWTYCSSESNGLAAGHYRVNIFGTTCNKWMITPDIDLSEASNPLLTFNAAFTKYSGTAVADGDIADDKFMILVSTNNGQTWSVASDISLSTLASLTYIPQYVNLANYAGETVRIAFYGESTISGGDNNLHIDNISIDESTGDICYPVSGLAASNVTADGATLTWDGEADSYNVYTIAGNDTTLVDNVTDTFMVIDELTAITSYTYGVRSVCGSDESDMVSITFRTACSAIAIDSENTYTENFDSYTVSVSSSSAPSNYPNHEQPACWEFLNMSASSSAYPQAFMTGYSSYAVSGNCLFFKSSNSTPLYAILPDFEATTALQLQFSYRNEGVSAYNGTILVGVMSDASDATTFVALDSCAQTTTMTHVEVNIPAAALEDGARVAFCYRGGTNNNYYAAIDNVVVREAPACLPVSGLTVSNVAARTATLNWSGDADGYTIYDMRDTSAYEYANDTTVVLYALDPETAYTFGVTANCGSDESDMRTVSFTTLISCPAPTNLAAALTPGNGTVATLSWHEAGEAAEWQICIDGDMENLIDVTDTTYDMTGLTPEQAVTAKVRAICGADDTSAWSSTITFTPTDAYTLTVNNGTATNSKVPVYGNWVDNHIKSQFIIPAADLSAMAYGNITKLTFYSSDANKSWGAASFEVYMTETSETTVNSLAAVSDMTQVYTGSLGIANNVMEITLTTPYQYMGGNLMIAFEQPTSGTYSNCTWYGVDATGASQGGYGSSVSQQNFLPRTTFEFTPGEEPSCLPVSNLAVSDITTDGATLSWTGDASSYNVYVISGSDTTIAQNVSDVTVTLTGLTPMTQYTYGVRSACGGDESDIRVVTFSTACAAVTLPYTETFASTSATRNCWNLVSNNTANVGGDYGMGFVTVSGRETMRFSSYSNASDYNQYGFSPLMNVSTDATNLQVKVVYATYGSNDKLKFGYITATDTVWDPTEYTTTGNSDWQSQTFVVPVTATQLAVHYYGNYQYYAWVDSVVVTELTGDYCYPVSALTVDSATTTSISLSWTSDATSFTVLDMSDSSVIAANVTTTSYEVTGLTAMTAYTFGVVVNCATGNSDTMTITANTTCADVTTLPYYEGFDNANLGCWTTVNGSTDGENWFAFNPSQMSGGVTAHNGAYVASSWSWNGSAMNANAWLISPKFVLPTINTGDSLTFSWWELTASGYPDSYSVAISTTNNDTASFTVVRPHTQAATTWTQQTIDLTAYAGQSVYVAFHHQDYDMNYLFIDDISLYQGAYVPPAPDTLKVTFATADATMGTTDPAPGVYNYIDGDTIFFGSQANNGYIFQKWVIVQGDGAPQELGPQYANGYYVLASNWMSYDSVSFTAYFEPGVPDSVQVTYAVNNATMGTITPAAGTYNVVVGSAVTAQATPNTGYELTAWVLGIYNATGSLINADTTFATDADFSNPVNYGPIPQSFADSNYTITVTALFDVQSTPQPVTEATIAASDIVYWVGSGNNQMVMAVNWANAAYAWGVRFNGSITVQNALDTIAAYDPRFNWTTGSYGLGDITFVEGNINLAGDTTSYWESKNNGITDAGLYQTLANNDFEKWAQPVAGVVTDSTYDSTYNYWWYTYTYPMTITPMWAPQVTPTNLTVTYATNDANLGTTNPAPGTYTYGASDTVFFNAIPTTGNSFVAWIIDYSDGTADTVGAQYQSGYYFLASTMMGYGITSMTFTAYFQAGVPTPDSVAVTYTVNDATMGSITPNGTVMTAVGDSIAATATANAGYELYGWRFTVYVNGAVASDTTLAIVETSINFGALPQFYADANATVTITAMFQQQVGIEDADISNVNVYSANSTIYVRGAEGQSVYVFDVNGRMLNHEAKASESCSFRMENTGVYLVKIGNAAAQRVIVVR